MGSDLASHAVQDGQKGSFLALFWRWAQSGRGSDQIAYPDQIVGGQREGEHPADPSQTTVASLAQAADRLDPAEDLLNPFAFLLTDQITRMTSRALIDNAGLLARNMGCYLVVAQLLNKLFAVVPFVATQGYTVLTCNLFHHRQRGLRLCPALRQVHAAIDCDTIAVLHQHMASVAELRLLARSFARQPGFGIGGRLMGRVGALLAMKIYRGIARVVRGLPVRAVLALETFVAGPRLNQGAVYGETLGGKQVAAAGRPTAQ